MQAADNTGRNSYLESRILAADPVELIHILYEHAVAQVRAARASQQAGDIAGRANAVTKVLAILGELESSLDHKVGGSISLNLARLYEYMRKKLLEASAMRQTAPLDEVESLLTTLEEGWSAMQHKISAPVSNAYAPPADMHTLQRSADASEVEYAPQAWFA